MDANPNDKLLDATFDSHQVDDDKEQEDDDDDESRALLSPTPGMSKKPKRKVQWNDTAGNKLVEILEFQPSDASDTDEDDDLDSCICSVM